MRFHVATSKFHISATSRRGFLRRDVILTLLYHVATCIFTSRRQTVKLSVTSRRDPARRDVVWSCALSRHDVNPHVSTWACLLSVTSRSDPARRDVALFLAQEWFILHLHRTPLSSETLAPSRTVRALPCRSSVRPGRRPLPCSPTTVSHPLWPVLGHSGISTTVCPILAWVQ